ncbi:serine--tRNA ligase [Patescibacteria group bacterium]|nr:serine--tRNA ligase [Patescibacteria group bacterium]
MIDIKIIRENPDLVRAGITKKRGNVGLVDEVLAVDAERRELRQQTETLQAEQNKGSAAMASATPEERERQRDRLKEVSDQIQAGRGRLAELDAQYLMLMRQIPNLPDAEVPEGGSDKENVVIKTVGDKPAFDFTPKDHEQLARDLDLLDFERAAKVSGTKFYYLKNELVILEQAVLRFVLDVLKSKGFTVMRVPQLARVDAFYGAGHFSAPEDETEGDAYRIERDGLYLAGTAEVGLVSYHAGEILHEQDLTARYAGISGCFRRESGTYGKEARGLYRVHEFNKVEMVSLTRPEDSAEEHQFLLDLAEDFLQKLGLPYQVVLNCGGDLGTPQAKKWDIETWMAGMGKYGETHSCSNDTDYQARSLGIRFRRSGNGGEKEIEYVHTLNNTALASPRILIPLLENNQQKDGSVLIPEVLIPYTGFDRVRLK